MHRYTDFPYFSLYVFKGADKENLSNNQELFKSVMVSFILVT